MSIKDIAIKLVNIFSNKTNQKQNQMKNLNEAIQEALASAENGVEKFENFIKNKSSVAIIAFTNASKISTEFVNALNSPTGIIVENIIASAIPQGKTWTVDVVELATIFGKNMQLVATHIPSAKGIALMMCANIIHAIDKTKTSNDLATTIKDIQSLFQ